VPAALDNNKPRGWDRTNISGASFRASRCPSPHWTTRGFLHDSFTADLPLDIWHITVHRLDHLYHPVRWPICARHPFRSRQFGAGPSDFLLSRQYCRLSELSRLVVLMIHGVRTIAPQNRRSGYPRSALFLQRQQHARMALARCWNSVWTSAAEVANAAR